MFRFVSVTASNEANVITFFINTNKIYRNSSLLLFN